jgi:hypothetical protein
MKKYHIYWTGVHLVQRVTNRPYCKPMFCNNQAISMRKFIMHHVFNEKTNEDWWSGVMNKMDSLIKMLITEAPMYYPSEAFICFTDYALHLKTNKRLPIQILLDNNIVCSIHFEVEVRK